MTNPLKTKHLSFFLPALTGGGAERVFVNLANHLARQGHKIDVLVMKQTGPFVDELCEDVRIIELGGKGMVRSIFPLLSYMSNERPAWIISALAGPNLIAVIARFIQFLRFDYTPKIAVTEHIAYSHHAEKAIHAKSFRSKMRSWLGKYLLSWADRIICVSQGVADELVQNTNVKKSRIHVINNPFDVEAVLEKGKLLPDHPWFQNRGDYSLIVSAGRLKPQKDFETLIRAVEPLDSVRLLILGEGEDKPKYEALIEALGLRARVQLAGFATNPFSYIAHADLFVLSTHYEGFGNVVVEALISGTPVISSDCEHGPREILEDGKYGALVPVADVSAMREAIQHFLDHKADIQSKREARMRRGRDFDTGIIAEKYLEVLEDD